jgi:hypothetical protein
MCAVPTSVTVWAVELRAGASPQEIRGTLALTSDALVFTPHDEPHPERRYPLQDLARVRRLRGSPVLMIVRESAEGPKRTAFYFVQPPPLQRPEEPIRPTPLSFGRSSRRKIRRQNVSYLGLWNREKLGLLREWERQVKTAVAAARS